MTRLPFMTELLIFSSTMMLVFGVLVLFQAMSGKRSLAGRVERIRQRTRSGGKGGEAALLLRKKKEEARVPFLPALMKILPRTRSLEDQLTRADIDMSANQFLFMCIGLFAVVVTAVLLLGKPPMLGGFLGFIVGVWLPLKIVKIRIAKQLKRFLKIFPDAIDLIVRGLRSGLPVGESMAMIAREVPQPVGGAFEHVTNIMKLGVPLEKALQETARQLDCTEFNFFTTSIILQRETGGNLSEILSNLGEVLRKREMMQLKIKALTSEARASAWILASLPFLVAGGAHFLNPDFLRPLFEDPSGKKALVAAFVLLFSGIWVMRRLARFEI